jgi:hypothetical protein
VNDGGHNCMSWYVVLMFARVTSKVGGHTVMLYDTTNRAYRCICLRMPIRVGTLQVGAWVVWLCSLRGSGVTW